MIPLPTHATRSLSLRLLQAWNDRDAPAMAECFTGDGTMTGFDGSLAEGRPSILEHLTPIFADHPTASFVTLIASVRAAGSCQVLVADVGMVAPGATELKAETLARQTVVACAGDDGQWRISLFQNTPTALHWDDDGREALLARLQAAYRERGPLPHAIA